MENEGWEIESAPPSVGGGDTYVISNVVRNLKVEIPRAMPYFAERLVPRLEN